LLPAKQFARKFAASATLSKAERQAANQKFREEQQAQFEEEMRQANATVLEAAADLERAKAVVDAARAACGCPPRASDELCADPAAKECLKAKKEAKCDDEAVLAAEAEMKVQYKAFKKAEEQTKLRGYNNFWHSAFNAKHRRRRQGGTPDAAQAPEPQAKANRPEHQKGRPAGRPEHRKGGKGAKKR